MNERSYDAGDGITLSIGLDHKHSNAKSGWSSDRFASLRVSLSLNSSLDEPVALWVPLDGGYMIENPL